MFLTEQEWKDTMERYDDGHMKSIHINSFK